MWVRRDAVLCVRLALPETDAQQRIPTLNFSEPYSPPG